MENKRPEVINAPCTVFSIRLFVLLFLSFFSINLYAQYTEVYSGTIDEVYYGEAKWGDYDKDGKLDVFVTGYNPTNHRTSKLFRNTGSGFTEVFAGTFTGVYLSMAEWGDIDNDGDLDLFLAGNAGARIAKIYRNDGTGFTEIYSGQITGLDQGDAEFGDYNNDGKLDLITTGYSNLGPRTSVYQNTGSGFTEVFAGQLPSVQTSSASWGDYNNDGYLDLAVTGRASGNVDVAKIYQNNSAGGFTEVYSGQFTGVYRGTAKWGDYDDDKKLDLIISGEAGTTKTSKLYRNTGSGFTEVFAGTFLGMHRAATNWGDYDNDGYLDLIVAGQSSIGRKTQFYKNNSGGSSFSLQSVGSIDGVYLGCAEFGDYDSDGDLDLITTGFNQFGAVKTAIYQNGATSSNAAPVAPGGLTVSFSYPKVYLSWNAASDATTAANGLTYNVRIGSSAGASDVLSPMALSTGVKLTPGRGNALNDTVLIIDSLASGTYYWTVQSIDHGLKGSTFASEQSFTVTAPPILTTNSITGITATGAVSGGNISSNGGTAVTARGVVWSTSTNPTLSSNTGSTTNGTGSGSFSSSLISLSQNTTYYVRAYATNTMGTAYGNEVSFTTSNQFEVVFPNTFDTLNYGDVEWIDFDKDGDLDISITGTNGTSLTGNGSTYFTRFYRNNGSSFSEVYSGQVPGVVSSSLDWGDYDNDGDPDLLITGHNGSIAISKIYQNTGSGFSEVYSGQLAGFYLSEGRWVDFDQDGKLDISLIGYSGGRNAKLYRNTGSGFTEVFANQLEKLIYADIEWADYDNDGDPDVAISGLNNSSTPITKIYQNNLSSGFSEVFSGQLTGVYRGDIKWGDYNSDGKPDLFVTGDSDGSSNISAISKVYTNNTNSFSQIFSGFITGLQYSAVDWGDIDNDGDLDFIVSGDAVSGGRTTKIYTNNGGSISENHTNQIEGVYLSAVKWGDYDNDNDIDLLISGINSSNGKIVSIYRNASPGGNTTPYAPGGLTSGNPFPTMTLNWSAASDGQTSSNGLTYDVRIGTTSGGHEVRANSANSNGFRQVPVRGQINGQTSLTVRDLAPGTYYWSVQSIDNSYKGSTYAAEQSFTIPSGIIWGGSSWSNTTGPSASTSGDDLHIYSGDTANITVAVQVNNATIYSGAILKINSNQAITINGNLTNNGTIVIEDDASLVQVPGSTISGSGIAKISRTGGNSALSYQIWSSPVTGEALLDVFPSTNLYDIYAFNANLQAWKHDYSSLTPTNGHANSPYTFLSSDMMPGADGIFNVGTGYYAVGNNSAQRTFEGTMNNEIVSVPVVSTSLGNNPNWTGDDWNLVGNPFPSAINATLFWQENAISNNRISNAIYYWSDDNSSGTGYHENTDFATWNASGGTAATGGGATNIPQGFISSCQGFWVKANSSTNIVFNNNMRVAGNNDQFFKGNGDWKRTWVNLTNEKNNFNQLLFAFNGAATDGLDPAYDAQKMVGNAKLSFGSMLNNDVFAIQAFPPLKQKQEKIIELSVTTKQPGLHTMTLDSTQNMEDVDIILVDKETGKNTNIKLAPYTVYLKSGTFNSRFYIRFKKKEKDTSTGVENATNDNSIRWYTVENNVWVETSDFNDQLKTVAVYNLEGKLIQQQEHIQNSKSMISTQNIAKGVYLIKVEMNSGKTQAFKIVH